MDPGYKLNANPSSYRSGSDPLSKNPVLLSLQGNDIYNGGKHEILNKLVARDVFPFTYMAVCFFGGGGTDPLNI
jgi:hypothetical protein